MGEVVTTIPTIGFNVESVQHKNLNLTVWDIGGQEKVSILEKGKAHISGALVLGVNTVLCTARPVLSIWRLVINVREAHWEGSKGTSCSMLILLIQIRVLWKHYYQNTQAVIFVVDSCDKERLTEAKEELHRALADDELRIAKLLVFANKQDMPGAVSHLLRLWPAF